MVKKYNQEALLADYDTGSFTQRELAKKYGISNGSVANLTRGRQKKNEQLVNKKVEVIQESKALTEQELSAVEHTVQFKLAMLNDIENFTNKAMIKAGELIDLTDSGSDFKAVVEGVDKLSVLTRINSRHAQPTQIQNNNNTLVAEKLGELANRLPN